MTFIEATGSGRDFRHPDMDEGCYFGFKGDELREFFADGGNSFPRFGSKDFFRDDWEFVKDEVDSWSYELRISKNGEVVSVNLLTPNTVTYIQTFDKAYEIMLNEAGG